MTPNSHLTADLRHWVADRLPGLATVADVSWPRGDSRVWRVAAGPDVAFVKLSPSPENYTREVRGFGYAAGALAADEAPRLLAADPDLRAIMSSPLPGRIVRGLAMEPDEELRVHELAGRLLRRWHDYSGPISAPVREAIMASVADQAAEAETSPSASRRASVLWCAGCPGSCPRWPRIFRWSSGTATTALATGCGIRRRASA